MEARSRRDEEFDFIAKHPEALARFAGEWVVLEKDQIVSHSPDHLEAIAQARANGLARPFSFYVSAEAKEISMGI